MIQPIKCTQCKTEGTFPIQHKIRISTTSCKTCFHITEKIWSYYFCSINCFNLWLNHIAIFGISCEDCYGTGNLAGYKYNGDCPTCDGSGIIKRII